MNNSYLNLLKILIHLYNLEHPVRSADVHSNECKCLRCVVDQADAYVKEQEYLSERYPRPLGKPRDFNVVILKEDNSA